MTATSDRFDSIYENSSRLFTESQRRPRCSLEDSLDLRNAVFDRQGFPENMELYEVYDEGDRGDYKSRGSYRTRRRRFDININANSDDDSEDDDDDDVDGEVEEVFDITKTTKYVDKFLFIWHTSLMLVCLFLLIVGIVLRFHFTTLVLSSVKAHPYFEEYERFVAFNSAPRELVFGDLTQTLGNALIVLNGVHILCIMMYMSFQIHKNHFTLPVVCIISGVVVIMEINATNVYMSETSAQSKEAKDNLERNIRMIYNVEDSTVFSVTHDIISVWGHCCGVTSMYDFQNHTGLKFSAKTDKERKPIQYPPSCCNQTFFSLGDKARDAVKNCAFSGEGVYSMGCYTMMFEWLSYYCILYATVILWQLIDILVHLILYRKMVTLFRNYTGQKK
ncbi:hypothetical protein BgiBS90_034142 [Biomphalaria glabrata]|nr:hypothetical protein BgiBS90_034142 [Biomphalaria glabrata]